MLQNFFFMEVVLCFSIYLFRLISEITEGIYIKLYKLIVHGKSFMNKLSNLKKKNNIGSRNFYVLTINYLNYLDVSYFLEL